MPACEICQASIKAGRYCTRCAREQKDDGLPGWDGYDLPDEGLSLDDLELARSDYEYQAEHAEDIRERNFFQRQADQLAIGIESMEGSA